MAQRTEARAKEGSNQEGPNRESRQNRETQSVDEGQLQHLITQQPFSSNNSHQASSSVHQCTRNIISLQTSPVNVTKQRQHQPSGIPTHYISVVDCISHPAFPLIISVSSTASAIRHPNSIYQCHRLHQPSSIEVTSTSINYISHHASL